MDVNTTIGSVRPVGCEYIRKAITVDVAGNRQEHSAERLTGRLGLDHEFGFCSQGSINVSSARSLHTGGRSANHEQHRNFGRESCDSAPEAVTGPFPRQLQEQSAIAARVYVSTACALVGF